MKKTWNTLFRSPKDVDGYRGDELHDTAANVDFMSYIGVSLGMVDGTPQAEARTGEMPLGG